MTVLVVRYFLFVGGALVALIFAVGWYWPASTPPATQEASTQDASAPTSVEQEIHIRSTQRWPAKVVIDTSIPTIVPPPPAPVVAENKHPAEMAAASPLDARAEVKPVVTPAPPPRRQARVRRRAPRPMAPTYAQAGPMAPGWPFNW